jgi:uncharacterized protein (TIGR03437 family)
MRYILATLLTLLLPLPCFAGCDYNAILGHHFVKTGEGSNGVKITVEDIWFSDNKRAKLYENGRYLEKTIEITKEEFERMEKDCDLYNHKWPMDIETKIRNANKAGVAAGPLEPSTAAQTFEASDLNGDGNNDFVTVNFNPPGVVVELGRSTGRYESPVRYNTDPTPEALLLADFNGDGRDDLAVAAAGLLPQNSGGVAILLGNANGTLAPAVSYKAGVAPTSLTTGDFNGDGRLDLAVANRGSAGFPGVPNNTGDVSVLLGNGDATFQPAVPYAAGQGPASILAAYINRDAHLDLAVANRDSGTLAVLLGTGVGTFQPALNSNVGYRPTYLGVGEFNGDLSCDLAILHRDTATISVWLGNGDGSLRANGRYLAGAEIESFVIVPMEGFSRPTIVTPDASGPRTLVLHVDLDGTLVAPPVYPLNFSSSTAATSSLTTADFNRDGKPDLATGGNDQAVLLLSKASPGFSDAQPLRILRGGVALPAQSVAAGDFNADGSPDLAVAHRGNDGISILAGRGDGTFQTPTVAPLSLGTSYSGPYSLTTTDLNGDGSLDLVAVNERVEQDQGTVSVFRGNGDGTFRAPGHYPVGNRARAVTAGDFNNDGRLDLAAVYAGDLGSNRGGARLLLANADGTFQPGSALDAGLSPVSAAAADFNGDRHTDLAVSGQMEGPPSFTFGVSLLFGNGNGTFQPRVTVPTTFGPGFLAAGDFNRDAVVDLVVAHCCGETDMTLLQGAGDGTFQLIRFPGGANPVAFVAADFLGDDRIDVAVLSDRAVVSVLENRLPTFTVIPAPEIEPSSISPDSIVSIYGTKLANATAAAPSADWPLTLAGTGVRFRDSEGVEKDAAIAFASPGQLNVHLPPGLASGFATMLLSSANGGTRTAQTFIERVKPALFSAGQQALAAAWLLRAREGGEQLLEPVVQLNAAGQLVPRPIDFESASDRLFLLLYGTGIRSGASTSVTIGGEVAPVLFAGPQGEFPGLDQVNVEILRSLAGRGLVDVLLTTDEKLANAVHVQFR